MKKMLFSAIALVLCGGMLASCTNATSVSSGSSAATASSQAQSVELTVFAAASLTETFEEIAELYKTEAPNVSLQFTFDSSGTLKTQIEEGAACDVFISAAQKQMDQLDIQADASVNTDGLDFIDHSTRFNFLENQVVLVVPQNNPASIQSFADLTSDKLNLIALGNEDVPVGAYSTEILTHLGVLTALEENQKITYGSNVKEVTTQVSEGSADCGIIYATDAFRAGLTVVDKVQSGHLPCRCTKKQPTPPRGTGLFNLFKNQRKSPRHFARGRLYNCGITTHAG
jgi:molybdate transport system substrate-binding protein